MSCLIAEELAVITGDEAYTSFVEEIKAEGRATMPTGGLIRSVGYGATRRLPGFDDGGNYKENRRVEIGLLVEGDEPE